MVHNQMAYMPSDNSNQILIDSEWFFKFQLFSHLVKIKV